MLVRFLSDKGRMEEALDKAMSILSDPAIGGREAGWVRTALAGTVPPFHGALLRDQARNDAYDAALRRAVRPGDHVLDIGTGSGLLAMMAARAGAGLVTAVEMNAMTAALARRVVRANALDDVVRVVAKHSDALRLTEDLPRPADVVVSEIISNKVLGQKLLPVYRDVLSRLLAPGGRVIPGRVAAIVGLGWHPRWAEGALRDVAGFDLSAFDPGIRRERLLTLPQDGLELRSDTAVLFDFDLADACKWPGPTARVRVRKGEGEANCLMQWLRITFDDSGAPGSIYENRPGWMQTSCWAVNCIGLEQSQRSALSGEYDISGRLGDDDVEIWLE